mgnify:CR=1 FL=1
MPQPYAAITSTMKLYKLMNYWLSRAPNPKRLDTKNSTTNQRWKQLSDEYSLTKAKSEFMYICVGQDNKIYAWISVSQLDNILACLDKWISRHV